MLNIHNELTRSNMPSIYLTDLASRLNGIDLMIESLPPEQRDIARRVLEIVAVSSGLDVAPDRVSEVVT